MSKTQATVRPPWLASIERDLPPLLTIAEVAKLLRVNRKTIQRWIAERTLSAVRSAPGTRHARVVISRAVVLDWLAERETH